MTRLYAIMFAAAAGLGLALGYLLGLVHVAWVAAAAMFIMRPVLACWPAVPSAGRRRPSPG